MSFYLELIESFHFFLASHPDFLGTDSLWFKSLGDGYGEENFCILFLFFYQIKNKNIRPFYQTLVISKSMISVLISSAWFVVVESPEYALNMIRKKYYFWFYKIDGQIYKRYYCHHSTTPESELVGFQYYWGVLGAGDTKCDIACEGPKKFNRWISRKISMVEQKKYKLIRQKYLILLFVHLLNKSIWVKYENVLHKHM